MLIIFGGLPGTGKTTMSKHLARQLNAVYLRIDTVEQTLWKLNYELTGPEGYIISYALAKENLQLGRTVLADSVNPIELTRQAWRQVAHEAKSAFIEIELICSDKKEHQKRIESRIADLPEQKLPTWQDVLDRQYEQWKSSPIVIDTSKSSIEEAVQKILAYLQK